MECLNPDATVDECNLSEMIGYLGAILAGVFVCSCILSGCCFYCRWKIKKPDVGAITLKSSKTGVKQEVRFHVYERKGTEDASQVGKTKSLASGATTESRQSQNQKKTVVSWQLDTQNASSRSLVSTGKVLLTTVGEAKTPRDLQRAGSVASAPASNAPSPKKKKKDKSSKEVQPSSWRSQLESLSKIIRYHGGIHKEAYEMNASVEYFSASNGVWTPAVIVSTGEFLAEGLPSYTVRVGRQRRHKVPIKFIRPPLLQGETVSFFPGFGSQWTNATIAAEPKSATLGYELDIVDDFGKPLLAVAGRLRRRFMASQGIQIYQGPFCGWVDATVTEDVLENADEVPGQFLLDTEKKEISEALSPEVVVKCSLLNSDAEEAEVLELPSGCVRYAGRLSTT